MATSGLVKPQKSDWAAGHVGRPHNGCPPSPKILRTSSARTHRASSRSLLGASRRSGVLGRPARRDLMMVDKIGGGKNEHLAHHVRVLLVAAHETDHLPAGRMLDHRLEAFAHQLLELEALLNDGRAA